MQSLMKWICIARLSIQVLSDGYLIAKNFQKAPVRVGGYR